MQEFDVCENIRRIIKEKGLKQKCVAIKAGFTDQQFSNLLNGRRVCSAYDILRISNALEVLPNDLFGFSNKTA